MGRKRSKNHENQKNFYHLRPKNNKLRLGHALTAQSVKLKSVSCDDKIY